MADMKELAAKIQAKQTELAVIFNSTNNGKDLKGDSLKDVQDRGKELNIWRSELKNAEEIETLYKENQEADRKSREIVTGVNFPGGNLDKSGLEPNGKDSLGSLFVKSDAFKKYNKSRHEGPDAVFDLKAVFQTSTDNGASIGFAPQITRNGVVMPFPVRTPKMDEVIRTTRTEQPIVLYQEVTTWTNGAGSVGEDDPNQRYSTFIITDRSTPVKKLRVALPISDDMMDDASYLEDWVNTQLLAQLALAKDDALIGGDGTGHNLLGLTNQAGILTRSVGVNESAPDAFHRALTQIYLTSRFKPNGIVIHPLDWENIRLLKTSEGVYIYGPPTEMGPMRLWGIDVVDTDGLTAGTSLIGAFDLSCTQAVRRGVTMSVSTENEDNFMRGRITVKAEMRLALVCYRPTGILKLSGL
jgi:HK97 family phage major capsid protein